MESQELPSVRAEDKEDSLSLPLIDDNKAEETKAALDTAESTHVADQLHYWSNRALHFLSHASNETLGACFIGLGASTYLVLGRVGLVLIGVVGGVVLHATWDGSIGGDAYDGGSVNPETARRKELGLEVVRRVWRWRDSRGQETSTSSDENSIDELDIKLLQGKTLDFSGFEPKTAEALDVFTSAIIRDYVKWWYSPVLPSEEIFPDACRQTLTAFLLSLSGHMARKRPTEMFLTFVINSSSIFIALLAELATALSASPNTDPANAIDTYISLKPDSSLAQMLDQKAQSKKLDLVAEDILQNFLDPKAYNLPPVHIFLRQILSKLVLGMTLETCSKADWINGWIVYLLEDGEPELMQMIDDSIEQSAEQKTNGNSAVIDELGDTRTPAHRRQTSKAEEAMEDALEEARRLTQMIEEDELRRAQAQVEMSHGLSNAKATPQQDQVAESANSEIDGTTDHDKTVLNPTDNTQHAATAASSQFTSFDQLPPAPPLAEETRPVLTLHNAKISIFDDSVPGDKSRMKSKPIVEYLVQIEPSDSRFSGWMIVRKYVDFEVLHEVLRRISVITGVPFTSAHAELPSWKTLDKTSFRTELERYLMDAVKFQQLAESEGMKRFLEKDQGLLKSPAAGKGLGWPDPLQMGKGMFDVLAKAPKEVAGGGKALIGGVTNVFGGAKKSMPGPARTTSSNSLSFANGSPRSDRQSTDILRKNISNSPRASQDSLRRPEATTLISHDVLPVNGALNGSVTSRSSKELPEREHEPTSFNPPQPEPLNLPPPPSAIDEYESPGGISPMTQGRPQQGMDTVLASATASTPPVPEVASTRVKKSSKTIQTPMNEQEATVTVDLLFAVISELYTLSSAWAFRKTLLQAARTFLLRPGNPQLEAIRAMIQESVIDSNSSDEGIAKMVYKTRENSLPTEEELKKWPPPLTATASEELRVKARRLLVERGMPQALTSVMGAAASGEALGKVFDCLQIQRVAKSVMFGLMLQALRAAVQ